MTALVMLPGMMCDARLFAPQVAALASRYSIVLPKPACHDTFADMAAVVLAEAPPSFALAGLSMGGILAMEIFRQAPDRVERIALMDTNPRAETVEMRAAREPQIRTVRQGGLAVVMREEMKPNYLADGPRRAEILDLCMDMAAALGPDVFISQSRALQTRPDQQETLRAIKIPALVLCGEDDRPCPVERHELMHALIPGSHLEIVRGAGHLPTLEQPGLTNDALTRWLEL